MKRRFIFPSVLITLYIGAAMVSLCERDWRRVLYWLCAAGLNAAVTF